MSLLTDDFNRADSTSLGANWLELVGDWSISGNQLAAVTADTHVVLYNSPLETPNHYVELTLSVATSTSMGVIARSSIDGGQYYLVRNNGSDWTLFYQAGGSFSGLATVNQPGVNGDRVRLQCVDDQITVSVNDIQIISISDVSNQSNLYTGIRAVGSSTARYDNFEAGDVSGVVEPAVKIWSGAQWIDSPGQRIYDGATWQATQAHLI